VAAKTILLSDAVAAKLKEIAKKVHGSVDIGFIDSEQAPIAFWNEFGHKGRFPAPPRPFFRTMVAKDSPQWPKMMAQELKASNFDGAHTLAYMGEEIDGALKQSIIDTNDPPLSPTTLRLRFKFKNNPQNIRARDVLQAQADVVKGRKNLGMASGTQAKPLIWTGEMLNSTGYRVNSGAVMVLNAKTQDYEERK
jgi:hypothetical protein